MSLHAPLLELGRSQTATRSAVNIRSADECNEIVGRALGSARGTIRLLGPKVSTSRRRDVRRLISTTGFPLAIAASAWIEEVLAAE